MRSKGELRRRRRMWGRRRKRSGGPRGREKGRWDSWCGQIERDQCLLLFIIVCSSESQNAVLVSSWKIFPWLSFDFYFREQYMDRARRRVGGMGRRMKFLFFYFFFVNSFFVFFVQCFTIIIIKCKASFFMSFILISLFNTRFRSHLISFQFFFFKK